MNPYYLYGFLIGRIIFGGYFLFSGFHHFFRFNAMVEQAKAKSVPMPKVSVSIASLLLILGGLSVVLAYHPRYGLLLLALYLIVDSFWIHSFWRVKDPQMRATEMANFMRNVAILGAILMFLAIPGPWQWSLGYPD